MGSVTEQHGSVRSCKSGFDSRPAHQFLKRVFLPCERLKYDSYIVRRENYGIYLQSVRRELFGAKYGVEIETVEQTPHTRVYQIDQSRGYNTLRRQNVEVVVWEQHVDDLMKLVRAKREKQCPKDFCLLIAGRRGKMVYPQVIATDIGTMTAPFAEIWILGQSATNTFNVARLHPTILQLRFDVFEAPERATTDADVITKQKRGRETEFAPLGQILFAHSMTAQGR